MAFKDERLKERREKARSERASKVTPERSKQLVRKIVKRLGSIAAARAAISCVSRRTVENWYYGVQAIGSDYLPRVEELANMSEHS